MYICGYYGNIVTVIHIICRQHGKKVWHCLRSVTAALRHSLKDCIHYLLFHAANRRQPLLYYYSGFRRTLSCKHKI